MVKINILFLHAGAELYGSDILLLNLVKSLDKDKFNPLVILPTDGPLAQELERVPCRVRTFELGVLRRKYYNPLGFISRAYYIFTAVIKLLFIINREKIDIVYSNTSAILAGALAARVCKKPHLWCVCEIIIEPKIVWKALSFIISRYSTQVIAVSTAVKNHLCQGYKNNESIVKVIPHGIDISKFSSANDEKIRKEFKISDHSLLIGMIGRVNPWKGQGYFLEVAKEILKDYKDAKFMLVGDAFEGQEYLMDQLIEKVKELEIEESVIFCKYREDEPDILAAYDIFVLPSILPDPSPHVVLDAMAASKPIVANAHGGVTEMVEDGDTGLLVPPNNPAAMSEAILKLIKDKRLRSSMGKRGRKRLEEKFSQQRFVREIEKLCLSLYNKVS